MLMIPGPPSTDPALVDIDLYTPEGYANGESMHGAWRRMRAEAPVYWHERSGQPGFWCVTTHDLVTEVVRDTARFSSSHGNVLDIAETGDSAGGVTMSLMDPPDHAQLRSPLRRMLKNFETKAYGSAVKANLEKLLDPCLREETVDFAKLALHLPMLAVGDVIGIPNQAWHDIPAWTMAGVAPRDPVYASGNSARTLRNAHFKLFSMLSEQVMGRRTEPQQDLITALVELRLNGHPLVDDEILVNCYSLVMGANTTTPHVATHFVWAMAEQPDVWNAIRAGSVIDLDRCVREAVRWATPTNHLLRRAKQDVEVGDETVRAGDLVAAWPASGNRDEAIFTDPYVFDPARSPNQHLAYAIGPHYCIGAPLANMVLTALIELLRERVQSFEVAGDVRHVVSNFINGVTELPVKLTRA